MKNILQEANELTSGDRQKEYGHPKVNFQRVADLWSVVLGVKVSSHMVVICLILLKTCRAMQGYKRDTYVDISGYARCAEMLEEPDRHKVVVEWCHWCGYYNPPMSLTPPFRGSTSDNTLCYQCECENAYVGKPQHVDRPVLRTDEILGVVPKKRSEKMNWLCPKCKVHSSLGSMCFSCGRAEQP